MPRHGERPQDRDRDGQGGLQGRGHLPCPGALPLLREGSHLVQERPLLQDHQGGLVKGKAFTALGALLILCSLFFSYFELSSALQGSAEAWMALSALVCAGVLGVGMVR